MGGNAAELVAFFAIREGSCRCRNAKTRSGYSTRAPASRKWSQDVFGLTVRREDHAAEVDQRPGLRAGRQDARGRRRRALPRPRRPLRYRLRQTSPFIRDTGPAEFVVLAFSPDGKSLCAGAPLRSGLPVRRRHRERKRTFETKGLVAVTFAGDGALVAGACVNEHNSDHIKRDVKIWNTQTGNVVHTIPEARGPIAFSAGGKLLAGLPRRTLRSRCGTSAPRSRNASSATSRASVASCSLRSARMPDCWPSWNRTPRPNGRKCSCGGPIRGARLPKVADGPSVQVSFSRTADAARRHCEGRPDVDLAKIPR